MTEPVDPSTPGMALQPTQESEAQADQRAELLKTWALEAGFTRAGIARLEPSDQGEAFRRWLDRGDHANMLWIARRTELRERPELLLDGARTALCVAVQYHPLAGQDEETGDLWPRVARYARGQDYHDFMVKRLKALAARIEEAFPGCRSRPYVDTGPILERELAARAGLGVQGKNTNLLHRQWGSYFLLGELLLTLDLTPDEPITDLCGRCRRCLEHCPTEALREPYRLDSRRCISYWTIEHRRSLPEAAREMIGDWVFGCDICQEVCPWNYKAPDGDEAEFLLPEKRRELDLAGLLSLERDDYVERFRKSPMKRAKLEGLQRNAAVAMGNRGDEEYVPALVEAMQNVDEVVRSHAAWALGRIGGDAARLGLQNALDGESEASVRAEIERALASSERPPTEPKSHGPNRLTPN